MINRPFLLQRYSTDLLSSASVAVITANLYVPWQLEGYWWQKRFRRRAGRCPIYRELVRLFDVIKYIG